MAATREGNLWAMQVKCYDPESQVPTSEMDSFIFASSRPEFDHRPFTTLSDMPLHGDWCNGVTTWAIDDNTGEITYGRPDD